ncbi:hypothetical protein BG015_004983, partial [Linnemannia schmuckeri]
MGTSEVAALTSLSVFERPRQLSNVRKRDSSSDEPNNDDCSYFEDEMRFKGGSPESSASRHSVEEQPHK